jgi:hypothetical protein
MPPARTRAQYRREWEVVTVAPCGKELYLFFRLSLLHSHVCLYQEVHWHACDVVKI